MSKRILWDLRFADAGRATILDTRTNHRSEVYVSIYQAIPYITVDGEMVRAPEDVAPMLETRSEVDAGLAEMTGDVAGFRMRHDSVQVASMMLQAFHHNK